MKNRGFLKHLFVGGVTAFFVTGCGQLTPSEDVEFSSNDATLERLAESLAADTRIPTTGDLSGVWTANAGYSVQLEHKGEKVRGRGYHDGCMGRYDPFDIEGTLRDGTLSLKVTRPDRVPEYWRYVFTETSLGISFRRPGIPNFEILHTAHDLRRLEQSSSECPPDRRCRMAHY